MADEAKGKLLEVDEVRQKIADLKKRVAEMADYIRIDERRGKLAELEAKISGTTRPLHAKSLRRRTRSVHTSFHLLRSRRRLRTPE